MSMMKKRVSHHNSSGMTDVLSRDARPVYKQKNFKMQNGQYQPSHNYGKISIDQQILDKFITPQPYYSLETVNDRMNDFEPNSYSNNYSPINQQQQQMTFGQQKIPFEQYVAMQQQSKLPRKSSLPQIPQNMKLGQQARLGITSPKKNISPSKLMNRNYSLDAPQMVMRSPEKKLVGYKDMLNDFQTSPNKQAYPQHLPSIDMSKRIKVAETTKNPVHLKNYANQYNQDSSSRLNRESLSQLDSINDRAGTFGKNSVQQMTPYKDMFQNNQKLSRQPDVNLNHNLSAPQLQFPDDQDNSMELPSTSYRLPIKDQYSNRNSLNVGVPQPRKKSTTPSPELHQQNQDEIRKDKYLRQKPKNFIKRNLVTQASPDHPVHERKLADYEKPVPPREKNYGKVPLYLRKEKRQRQIQSIEKEQTEEHLQQINDQKKILEASQVKRIQYSPLQKHRAGSPPKIQVQEKFANVPSNYRLLPDEERQATLEDLIMAKYQVQQQYDKIALSPNQTEKAIRFRRELENKMDYFDREIKLFSKDRVYMPVSN